MTEVNGEFVQQCNKYLVSTCYVLGIILGTRTSQPPPKQSPCSHELAFQWRETGTTKQVHYITSVVISASRAVSAVKGMHATLNRVSREALFDDTANPKSE